MDILTSDTGVSIALVLSIVGATWIIASRLTALTNHVTNIEKKIDGAVENSWTQLDQTSWSTALHDRNPSLEVPDPKDPARNL